MLVELLGVFVELLGVFVELLDKLFIDVLVEFLGELLDTTLGAGGVGVGASQEILK